jgi:hypothetical protein
VGDQRGSVGTSEVLWGTSKLRRGPARCVGNQLGKEEIKYIPLESFTSWWTS